MYIYSHCFLVGKRNVQHILYIYMVCVGKCITVLYVSFISFYTICCMIGICHNFLGRYAILSVRRSVRRRIITHHCVIFTRIIYIYIYTLFCKISHPMVMSTVLVNDRMLSETILSKPGLFTTKFTSSFSFIIGG